MTVTNAQLFKKAAEVTRKVNKKEVRGAASQRGSDSCRLFPAHVVLGSKPFQRLVPSRAAAHGREDVCSRLVIDREVDMLPV